MNYPPSSSSSSELGKYKINHNNSDYPPLKKQKICNSSLYNKNYYFSSIKCVDFGNYFSICIGNNKNIYSVGRSANGTHDRKDDKIFPIKQIQGLTNIKMLDCGNDHSIFLNYDGDVFSFGNNYYNQLGISKKELKQTHIPQKINIPPCKQISCGECFTICLTEHNQLYSFGSNSNGELGLGNYNNYSSPQLIPDFNNIDYIVCGGFHCICKTYNNEFYSWGDNEYGQLGQGNYESCNKPTLCYNWPDNIISIKCGDVHTLLLTSEGHVYSFGSNSYGQLGINDKNIKTINIPTLIKDIPEIQRIECGYNHSMCIDINNNLWIFGNNYNGQLGLGDELKKYKPIIHPTLSNIIDISSGGSHTFVKTIDNKIYAFGENEFNQLGIKTVEIKQLTPIQVFKDNEDIWCSTIGKSKQKSARK